MAEPARINLLLYNIIVFSMKPSHEWLLILYAILLSRVELVQTWTINYENEQASNIPYIDLL